MALRSGLILSRLKVKKLKAYPGFEPFPPIGDVGSEKLPSRTPSLHLFGQQGKIDFWNFVMNKKKIENRLENYNKWKSKDIKPHLYSLCRLHMFKLTACTSRTAVNVVILLVLPNSFLEELVGSCIAMNNSKWATPNSWSVIAVRLSVGRWGIFCELYPIWIL